VRDRQPAQQHTDPRRDRLTQWGTSKHDDAADRQHKTAIVSAMPVNDNAACGGLPTVPADSANGNAMIAITQLATGK
jgi:hypothetical protein